MSEIRALPRSRPGWERDADVVVVGSGAAGMTAALTAARRGRRVLLLSKDGIGGGSTPLAQGGLAAAIGPGDSPALHQRDTLAAGAGLCDPAAVAALVSQAPAETARLVVRGARLEREALHLEGGHSRSRIITAGGDAIGAEVSRVLQAALLASPVQILTRCVVLDALTGERGSVGGVLAGICDDDGTLRVGSVTARAVVLATGGFGQAYATTTNPAGLTGDGLALAARAGAELQDLEFVQFHPTVLWQPAASGQLPLITEALRGAGAVLADAAGRAVMAGRHPLGDLAPRDIVAAAMAERMREQDADHLWLDATRLGRAVLERQFPTVTAACRAHGIDPVIEPIPVAPGAHYACGGIRADLDGRTSVAGLYAVGEAASTGVHGANRLGSNSLTEALIAGRRTGELLGRHLPGPNDAAAPSGFHDRDRFTGGSRGETVTIMSVAGAGGEPAGPSLITATGVRLLPAPAGTGVDPAVRAALAAAMSRHAGVLRDREGLENLQEILARAPAAQRGSADDAPGLVPVAQRRSPDGAVDLVPVAQRGSPDGAVEMASASAARPGSPDGTLDLATVEATSLHTVSVLITEAALARTESRGCHRWRDRPRAGSAEPARHTIVRVAAAQSQAATAPRAAATSAPRRAAGADNSNRPEAATAVRAATDASHRPPSDNSNRPEAAAVVRAAAAPASHRPCPDNSNRKASA